MNSEIFNHLHYENRTRHIRPIGHLRKRGNDTQMCDLGSLQCVYSLSAAILCKLTGSLVSGTAKLEPAKGGGACFWWQNICKQLRKNTAHIPSRCCMWNKRQKETCIQLFREQNIYALLFCTVYRCVALRTGPVTGLYCTYAAKSEHYHYERKKYIYKERKFRKAWLILYQVSMIFVLWY